jgi:hypothetical protein
MKWPDERQAEGGYPGRYREVADAFVADYFDLPWRVKGVASTRKAVRQSLLKANWVKGVPRPPSREQLQEHLNFSGLSVLSERVSSDDPYQGKSLAGALLAEAAGSEFCSRPSIARWRLAGQVIGEDPVARAVLAMTVKSRVQKAPRLLEDIKRIARELVRLGTENPGDLAVESEKARVIELHRSWRAESSLNDIWFGLRLGQYIMPFRSDWHIFDLLFEIDMPFAAELIDEYEAPFQPAVILDWGACHPRRKYAHWKALMETALSAFEENGRWNGRFLLPMLLYTAQDAVQSAGIVRTEIDGAGMIDDDQLTELVESIAAAVDARPDGCAAAFRWGAWLFRQTMNAQQREASSRPYGQDHLMYQLLDALVQRKSSARWIEFPDTGVPHEDELCVEAVRILAAKTHGLPVPGRELLIQLLPNEPEEFIEGENGDRMRALPSLFTLGEGRPDALGPRILAAALFDANVAGTYADLWRRTLTLREIVEHSHAYHAEGDGLRDVASRASETIRFVVALGISLIDFLEDKEQEAEVPDRRAVTLEMFSLLHDALREVLQIDAIGRRHVESLHNHLCVRRCLYEAGRPRSERFAAPLSTPDFPTLGDMLVGRFETSESFFSCLQMLLANGVERTRIEGELHDVDIDLDKLVDRAKRLNGIEKFRPLNVTGL